MCSNVMENGIKLTATLESQSPMIHFQARETGAVLDLCQYFGHKKLKGYADFFNSSSSFCCGVI